MKGVDDILDVLAGIFVFGVLVPIGLGIIFMMYKEDDIENVAYSDKTAVQYKGEAQVEEDDLSTLTRAEVILTTQVQDFNMPDKKKYQIVSNVDGISDKEYNLNGNTAYQMIERLNNVAQEVYVRTKKTSIYEVKTIGEDLKTMYSIEERRPK